MSDQALLYDKIKCLEKSSVYIAKREPVVVRLESLSDTDDGSYKAFCEAYEYAGHNINACEAYFAVAHYNSCNNIVYTTIYAFDHVPENFIEQTLALNDTLQAATVRVIDEIMFGTGSSEADFLEDPE
jgi:hypothetical protein